MTNVNRELTIGQKNLTWLSHNLHPNPCNVKISHFTPEELWESSKEVKYLTKGYTASIDGVQANTKANVPPTHSAISLQKWCNTLPRAMAVAEIAHK